MELQDLRVTQRRHWLFASVIFLACLGLGVVTAYLPPKTYRASATVTVTVNTATGNPARMKPIAVSMTAQHRSGCLQFNAGGKMVRILSLDIR